ncbi:MAG: hypothetical protein ABSF23_03795 [Terracidiphilus sp.]
MTDYGALADKLKATGQADKHDQEQVAGLGISPAAFYDRVKAQIDVEVEKANLELRKRGLPTIERIFLPSFVGKLSLTFGTTLLCNVALQESKGRISVVILGPPNRCEIARKEYLLYPDAAKLLPASADEKTKVAVVTKTDKVAAEIIGALLTGEFA